MNVATVTMINTSTIGNNRDGCLGVFRLIVD